MSGLAKVTELRQQRAKLIQQAREIQKGADERGEVMSSEERQNWDRAMDDADALKEEYTRMERLHDAERELSESQGRVADERSTSTREEVERAVQGRVSQNERAQALRAWFLRGSNQSPGEDLAQAAHRSGIDLQNKLLDFNIPSRPLATLDRDGMDAWERRALASGTDSAGGHTVPDDMMRPLEEALLRFGGIRRVAEVIRTDTGARMPWPTANDTSQKGEIIDENEQVNQQDVVFGTMALSAYKYSSKMILVPVELLQDSSVNIPEFLGRTLGTRIGRITNEHFTTGDGNDKPQGIVGASELGTTALSPTEIEWEDLVDLEHSVDPDYRQNARWTFQDGTLRELKKLKDGEDRPLWLPGLAVREADTILGYPYIVNQEVPAMAADQEAVLFGDLSKYKVRDVRGVTLLRLDERFADFHQVAFLAFSRHDGDLLDAGTNPVKHLLMGSES